MERGKDRYGIFTGNGCGMRSGILRFRIQELGIKGRKPQTVFDSNFEFCILIANSQPSENHKEERDR